MPRHIFEAYNGLNTQDAPANLVPVGTGPYRVVEFNKEDVLIIGEDTVNTVKIIYEPNPFFRESDKPFFSRVELQGGGGDAVMAAQTVEDRLADFGWNVVVGEEVLAKLEADGQVKLVSTPGAFVERIMFNFTDPNRQTADGERASIQFPHPFLTDKRVRQALAYAIDRAAIAGLYGRTGRVTSNVLVSPAPYNSPNTTYEFNLEKAAALLDEAGWVDNDGDGIREKDGVKLSLVFQTSINPVRQQTQEIVKAGLEKLGIEVELKNIDSSVFFGPGPDNTNTRRHFYADLEEFSFSNKNPDPNDYMKGWTCGEIAQKANNWSLSNWARYCNSAYDALYQQLATELDPAKRQELFIQMNDLLIEDVALIPLVHQADIFATSNTVEGYNPTPWDAEVWNIGDWRRK
jgi:peptide/nickel transport system substrate-binding protein